MSCATNSTNLTPRFAAISQQEKHKFTRKCERRLVLPLGTPLNRIIECVGDLNLAHYRMGDSLFESMAPQVAKMTHPVVSLSLKDNALTAKGGGALVEMLKTTPVLATMTHLDLSDNRIGNYALEGLAELLCLPKYDSILTKLDIANNAIGDYGVHALSSLMAMSKTIVELNFSNNKITEKSAPSLENLSRDNARITSLNLSYNKVCAAFWPLLA